MLAFLVASAYATPPAKVISGDDNQRYLALMLVNDNEDQDYRPTIEAAHNLGFNAVYLSVRWDAVKCHNAECASYPNWQPYDYWKQVDQEVEKAKSLGMKIALRIHLGSADLTPFGFPANRSEYLWGAGTHMKAPDGNIHLGGWQFRMFSYSKQSTIDRAKGFVGEVLGRYRSLIDENRLLFVSVTTGTSQELEYNYNYDLDYSDDMVNQYREWHKSKYCTDPMVAPRDFNSEQGKRWYAFRHKKLKEFIDQMSGHIKSFDSRIRVVLDFGSSFDGMSRKRGTMAFKDLTEKVDGLKVNDDYTYDHRFSMDILRGSLPGKWIMNEVLPYDDRFYLIPEFINSSYAHGAKVFCVVTGDPFKLYAMASVYTQVRDQWIAGSKGIMSPLPTTGSVNYNYSDIYNANFSYNRFTTAAGRNVYQEWLDQYNKNPSNAKAVNVYFDDSSINDNATCGTCTPPAAPVLTASSASITTGQSTTLTASGFSGTVTWSTGQTGSSISVSPGQTTTYTASCSVNGCTSPNASITVTVSAPPVQEPPVNCNAPAAGYATLKRWTNIGGKTVGDLVSQTNNFTKAPNTTSNLNELRTETNWGDAYGQQIQGYITAPQTGSYTFWISSDDNSELWLSTSEDPAAMQRVARVSDWTNPLQWNKESNQKSVAINLTACQRYYFEIRHKDGDWWDNLAVGWSKPGQSTSAPAEIVPGSVLSPYTSSSTPVCTPPSAPSLNASAASITAGQSTTLTASNCSGTVTWSTGQTGSSISVSPGQTTTYTATCSANGCTSSNGSVTVTVTAPAPTPAPTPEQPVSGSCVVNKVRLVFRTDCCFHRLNGASLQGSNDRNSWTTLYNFTSDATGKWQEFSFSNTTSYRYVRYVAAPNSAGELVELEFYNGGQKLSGTVFGSSGNFNNDPKYSFQRAMDGAIGEMWHGANQGTHNFVGLDLSACSSTACTPPSAPTLSASAASITAGQSTTLSASNCSGTVTWSTGQTGSSISVSPGQTTTYTATCSANGCTSSNGSVTVTVNNPAAEQNTCPNQAAGYVVRKRWTGIGGTSIGDLVSQTNNFTKAPNTTSNLSELRTETNWGDAYGQQIQGYITAPQTGSYTFWISSDDNSELWLSTSDDPAAMQRVARVTGWTDPLQWNRESNQKSAAINLTACQRYYFEIRHKEGEGGDNLAVGWSKPGQSTSAPAEIVPGSVLSPYTSSSTPVCTPPAAPSLNASAASITAGQSTTLSASNCSGTVTWSTGQTGSSISVSPGQTATYTATCSANGCTSSNGSVTVTVINADKTDAGTNCSTLEGFLDVADCGIISGWVYDRSNPNAVLKIDIYDNFGGTTLIQSGITAGNFRQDLLNAGKGNGNHGFQISTPAQLKNGQNRNVSVRVNGCSYTLNNSFKVFKCASNARTGAEEEEEVKEVSVASTELKVVSDQRMAAWPNPTKGELEVSFYVEEQKEAVLSVVDMMGVSWHEQKITGAGQHQEKIDLSHSAAGIYIIQLKKANTLETKKIIVTH